MAAIRDGLPGLAATVAVPYLDPDGGAAGAPRRRGRGTSCWPRTGRPRPSKPRCPFDHPLYVLYSSGTTGLPKPIVHGHGGILLEHLKQLAFSIDLGPGDRFFWFSTTGWMMWNLLVSGLAVGSALVLFDGDPASPDLSTLWRLAEETGTTYFGASAPFLLACRKAGLEPAKVCRPVPAAGRRVDRRAAAARGVPLGLRGGHHRRASSTRSAAGPTSAPPSSAPARCCRCGRAGSPAGRSGPRSRPSTPTAGRWSASRASWSITEPMPSMPVGFWGDADGSRYRAAYFEDFPGVWRHGDWIVFDDDGSCVISGRSDSTLNRGGVRLGTSEFYSVVEGFPEVADSLVVHLEDPAGDGIGMGELLLFVVPGRGRRRRRRPEGPHRRRSCAGRSRPATSPTPSTAFPAYPGRCRGRSWRYPSSASSPERRRTSRRAGGLWPTPTRSKRSSDWRPKGRRRELPLQVLTSWLAAIRSTGGQYSDESIPEGLENAIRTLSRLLLSEETLEATLGRVASLACRTLPACDMASVTMINDGRPVHPGPDRPAGRRPRLRPVPLASAGPCLEAYSVRPGRAGRRPRAAPTAGPSSPPWRPRPGVRSVLAVPLVAERSAASGR